MPATAAHIAQRSLAVLSGGASAPLLHAPWWGAAALAVVLLMIVEGFRAVAHDLPGLEQMVTQALRLKHGWSDPGLAGLNDTPASTTGSPVPAAAALVPDDLAPADERAAA